MKIKPSPQCTYCDELDDISHFFFQCRNVYGLWCAFFNLWNETNYGRVDFPNFPNQQDIVFGVSCSSSVNEVMNFCILHIKFYIYKQRLFNDNNMCMGEIRNILACKLDIEKKICEKDNKPSNFSKYKSLYDKVKQLNHTWNKGGTAESVTATGCDTFCSGAPPGDTMPSECSPGDRERQHDT